MNEIKRKDKLFIVVFALCALVMAIANPNEYDIRSVAWDVAMIMVVISSILWGFGELLDMITVNVSVSSSKPKTRIELIEMAGEIIGIKREHLSNMTDIELAGIVGMSESHNVGMSEMPSLGVILVASFKTVMKVLVRIYRGLIAVPGDVMNMPKTVRRWRKGLDMIWKAETKRL